MKPGEFFRQTIRGTFHCNPETGVIWFTDKTGDLCIAVKPYSAHAGFVFTMEGVEQPDNGLKNVVNETGQSED